MKNIVTKLKKIYKVIKEETLYTVKMLREDPWNAWYYWQGNYRLLAYNYFRWAIRNHIIDQYHERSFSATKCLINQHCIFCGCKTPNLFFANKACGLTKLNRNNRKLVFQKEEPCYGPMLSKSEYQKIKNK